MGIITDAGSGGCSCDPSIPTTDCTQAPCTAFMGTFLFFEILLLCAYVFTIVHVEIKSRKKSLLWRLILPTSAISCLAKVIRLGILANPNTRFSVGPVGLMFLYNTHLCFALLSYMTLLFFWMRLKHDLVANTKVFGRLLPVYITAVVITVVFWYAQVIAQGTLSEPGNVMFILMLINGLVCFSIAVVFITYAIKINRKYMQDYNKDTLFYKTYVGALGTSILIVAFCLLLLISNVTSYNTTNQYLIKHAIYEILFLGLLICIPVGFVIHYYRYYATTERSPSSEAVPSTHSFNKTSSMQSLKSQNSESSLAFSPSSPPLTPDSSVTGLVTLTSSLSPTASLSSLGSSQSTLINAPSSL